MRLVICTATEDRVIHSISANSFCEIIGFVFSISKISFSLSVILSPKNKNLFQNMLSPYFLFFNKKMFYILSEGTKIF